MVPSSWLRAIARVHPVHMMNATNPQTKPTDLSCESTDNWQLPSTSTVSIYYYYSAQKPHVRHACVCRWRCAWERKSAHGLSNLVSCMRRRYCPCCLSQRIHRGLYSALLLRHISCNSAAAAAVTDTVPVPSSRQHRNNYHCLQVIRENSHNCFMCCCVRQVCTMIHTKMWAGVKFTCCFRCGFCFYVLAFCVFFVLDYIIFRVLLALVVLGLVSRVWLERMSVKWLSQMLCSLNSNHWTAVD